MEDTGQQYIPEKGFPCIMSLLGGEVLVQITVMGLDDTENDLAIMNDLLTSL